MSPAFKGLVVVLVAALGLAALWFRFGVSSRPDDMGSSSVAKLGQIEKLGIPDFKLMDLKDREVSSDILRGRKVLVHFWASWCGPCIEEFPSLLQIAKDFDGKLLVVAVATSDQKSDILRFLKLHAKTDVEQLVGVTDPNFIVLYETSSQVASSFGTEKLPETYILNSASKMVRKIPNPMNWTSSEVTDYLKSLD